MFKKLFLLFVIQISFVFSQSYVDCAHELQKSLMAIQKLPEGRELIAAVQKEGVIRIRTSHFTLAQQFGAFWDPDQRIIYVNPSPYHREGTIIGSLLFELHNALNNSKIDHLDSLAMQRKIDKESYIEAMEYMEYENSIKASRIAQRGIDLGIFPEGAGLPTYRDFEEHYHFQKIGGHSAWFARTYDELSSM